MLLKHPPLKLNDTRATNGGIHDTAQGSIQRLQNSKQKQQLSQLE